MLNTPLPSTPSPSSTPITYMHIVPFPSSFPLNNYSNRHPPVIWYAYIWYTNERHQWRGNYKERYVINLLNKHWCNKNTHKRLKKFKNFVKSWLHTWGCICGHDTGVEGLPLWRHGHFLFDVISQCRLDCFLTYIRAVSVLWFMMLCPSPVTNLSLYSSHTSSCVCGSCCRGRRWRGKMFY